MQLRRSLGKPVTEVYRAESDVLITVNYDSQGRVCDIQLAGNQFIARRIGDQLVPPGLRGRQLHPPISLIDAMDCCESWAWEFEKVTMATSWGTTGQPVVRFLFKDRECVVKQPPLRPDRFRSNFIIQTPSNTTKSNAGNVNTIYRKYESTEPAVIIDLPAPELTPEAIAQPVPGEMIIEAVLRPSGAIDNIVQRGNLRNGMAARSTAAMRKIKFKPALENGKPVSQRVHIKYSLQKCDGDKICTSAVEILDP